MALINPALAEDIKKYGTFDFATCYNCGICTAVCNLTEANASFPRMMIRYSMLGMKEEILSSKELWMCYACGDCSETCPRQAAPGDLMASLRRYAIAHYERIGLAKLIFKNRVASVFVTLALALILGFFLLTLKPEMQVSRWIFQYLPYETIHNMGLGAFIIMGLSAFAGIIVMIRRFSKTKSDSKQSVKITLSTMMEAIWKVLIEAGTMKRYQDCDTLEYSFWKEKSWLVKPWFVHWSIMWGFIGLLIATSLDFLLKDPSIQIWWPSRTLGTLAGLFMVYGATCSIFYRLRKITRSYEDSRLSDWLFLAFLWLAGVTGFWIEISVTFNSTFLVNHVVFIIHTVISMELVILFAFSKFAHALYRPVALFFHYSSQ
jgi:ferredoxin